MANSLFTDKRISEEERVIMEINSTFNNGKKIPFLISHPGVGKTTLAKKVNPNHLVYNISSFNKSDLIGSNGEKPIWYSELFLLAINSKDERCLLIFDDFDRIDPKLQKYIFALTEEERKISSYVIPDNVDILLCGDSEEYTDPDFIIDFKLNSRLSKIEMKPNIYEWLHWANRNNVHRIVKSFLNEYPHELLRDIKDKNGKYNTNKSLTPKSWAERISNELYIAEETEEQLNLDIYMDEKSKEKFMDYCKKYYEYKIKEIIEGKVVEVNRFTYTDVELSFIVNALIASTYDYSEIENALVFLNRVGHSEYKDLYMSLWASINKNKEDLMKIRSAIIQTSRRGDHLGR